MSVSVSVTDWPTASETVVKPASASPDVVTAVKVTSSTTLPAFVSVIKSVAASPGVTPIAA